MAKFLSGFGVASALFVLVGAFLHLGLGWGPPAPTPSVDPLEGSQAALEPAEEEAPSEPRRRRRRAARPEERVASGPSGPSGEALTRVTTTGDDLREGDPRVIDGAAQGGEAQLSPRQIESVFDGAMPRIRRCLVLAAGDELVRGRLVFGLRIRGTGEVSAVSLTGPAAVTTGEAGECLRGLVRATRFPSFDGPEMLARYPIVLE